MKISIPQKDHTEKGKMDESTKLIVQLLDIFDKWRHLIPMTVFLKLPMITILDTFFCFVIVRV